MPSPKTRTVSFRVPDVPILSSKNYAPLLVILLIIAAFLIGVLVTKVSYLEKNGSNTTATAPTVPSTAGTTPAVGAKVNVSDGHLPIKGAKNAKVHIVEFADLRCPFCQRLFTDTQPQLFKDYVDSGKASFAFRHYAFLGPASTVAANGVECANEQNKFWEMHDYLYKNQPPESDTTMYTTDKLTEIAGTLGMDSSKFKDCLSSNKFQSKVDQDFQDGQKAGVNGTPATFVNGVLISGAVPYAQFKSAIDAALAK